MNDEVLIHHGIKGQRWGIRRFQNEDGTLTDAGKTRYTSEHVSIVERPKSSKEESEVLNQRSLKKLESAAERINAIRKEKVVKNAQKTAKYNQKYWEDQAKITEKYIKQLESGVFNSDFNSKKEVNSEIKIEKEALKSMQQHAKDWIDSQDYLKNLKLNEMTVKEVKQKTSKREMISNH